MILNTDMDPATQALIGILVAQVLMPVVAAFIQRKQGKDEDHIAAVPLLMAEMQSLGRALQELRQDVRAQAVTAAEVAVLKARVDALERRGPSAG
jgi:hypothetical protein